MTSPSLKALPLDFGDSPGFSEVLQRTSNRLQLSLNRLKASLESASSELSRKRRVSSGIPTTISDGD